MRKPHAVQLNLFLFVLCSPSLSPVRFHRCTPTESIFLGHCAFSFRLRDIATTKRVSEQVVRASWNVAAGASATASLACVPTWHEDFRKDVNKIDVPTLVMHGDADRILPITASGARTAKLIKGAGLSVVKDGPHCITWTHADEVNAELTSFLGKATAKRAV